MMRLFINSLAASAGGGLTYIRNVIPHLAARPGLDVVVALAPGLREEFRAFTNVEFQEIDVSPMRRFWYEQTSMPGRIRQCGADVLLSTGNFAIRSSPVPQILLSRNSVYTSADFYRDLRSRREYKIWLDTKFRGAMAKKSIRWANVTVAPSEAFAAELRRWTGKLVRTIHHGFDPDAFFQNSAALSADVEHKLQSAEGALKLLFVSHYNYYRNFETLLRALPLLRKAVGRPVKLLLTCELAAEKTSGGYNPTAAAALVKELGISDMVVELGTVPYQRLHQLYRKADIYVTPAYTETFAHPLVEAMASGLPVVASDLAVHREICGDAAVYFPRFSPETLSESVARLAASPETANRMASFGLERSRQFSWAAHVDSILALAQDLAGTTKRS